MPPSMPPPPGSGPGGYQPAPRYSPIDALQYGWRKFVAYAGPFLLMGLVVLVISVGLSLLGNFLVTGSLIGAGVADLDSPESFDSPQYSLLSQLGSSLVSLVVSVLSWIVGAAIVRGALDVTDTGHTSLEQMFSRVPWLQVVLASVLTLLITYVGMYLCIIPGLVAGFFLMYTTIAVVDGSSAIDGMRASFEFVKAHPAENLLLALLFIVVGVVAICCTFLLGTIVIAPIFYLAMAYTWRTLQGRPVAA